MGTYQRVTISGDIDEVPVRLAYKQAPPRTRNRRVSVTGFTLEPLGEGDYYGFTLDGDRRFLLGDFTVTHNSEESVRRMFEAAREHKAKHGFPAVVLMDECDSLLARRDRNTNVALNATIVPQFLAEMDGFDDHAAMFILCTNKPELLDPAVVREGRIDRKVKVERPRRDDAAVIFKIHLRGRPLVGDGHIERGVEELYSDRYAIHPRINGEGHVLLRDFVSGAMIANVIEMASTAAVMRDITSKRNHAMGISVDDILWAIEQTARGQRDITPELEP